MDNLRKLLEMLEDKLAYTKQLIADYDETMDYVSHSSLLGFAEGIEFVMEEIEERLEAQGHGSGVKGQAKGKDAVEDKKGQGTRAGKVEAKNKAKGGVRAGTSGKGKGNEKAKTGGKGRGRI